MMFKKLLLALLAARSIEAASHSRRAHFDWDKTDFVYVLTESPGAFSLTGWQTRVWRLVYLCAGYRGESRLLVYWRQLEFELHAGEVVWGQDCQEPGKQTCFI